MRSIVCYNKLWIQVGCEPTGVDYPGSNPRGLIPYDQAHLT